jgi:FKBP-type peptidyl-prolyl cis-trans isomerase FkpA
MKKNLIFLTLAAVGLASCNGGFKKGDAGMLYNIHTDKSGTNIKPGDFIMANVIAKNDADSVLLSTYENGHAVTTLIPPTHGKGDIIDGLLQLSEGDSATIKICVDSQKTQKPMGFKGKYITYDIKVVKVIPKGNLTDQVFQGNIATYMKGEADKVKGLEPGKIKKYLADKKLAFITTSTGLNYIVTKPGTGPVPIAGDTVMVNYVGKYVNDKVFETNIKDEATKSKTFNPMAPYSSIPVVVGENKVIPGWDQALMLFNKGTKATLVIPSDLAYRDQGNQAVGPYTPLVFDVEVVNIIHANPNAPKPVAPQMMIPQTPQSQPKK